MNFSPAFLPLSPLPSLSLSPQRALTTTSPRPRPRWTCASESHPFGNGGLNNVVDRTGYDREAERARFAKVKEEYAAEAGEREGREKSMWAIIYNVDVIQWRNNLMNAAAEFGLELRMDDVKVLPLPEAVVETMFEGQLKSVWAVERAEGAGEGDERAFVTAGKADFGKMVLVFQFAADAERFAYNMVQDGRGNVVASEVPMAGMKNICEDAGLRIGFVTRSFIQPSHFAAGMASE